MADVSDTREREERWRAPLTLVDVRSVGHLPRQSGFRREMTDLSAGTVRSGVR
jgi:hypothetical protein